MLIILFTLLNQREKFGCEVCFHLSWTCCIRMMYGKGRFIFLNGFVIPMYKACVYVVSQVRGEPSQAVPGFLYVLGSPTAKAPFHNSWLGWGWMVHSMVLQFRVVCSWMNAQNTSALPSGHSFLVKIQPTHFYRYVHHSALSIHSSCRSASHDRLSFTHS